MGFAEVDLVDLIRNRGTPIRRVSPLSSPDSRDRPGSLEYTVGYYGKLPPNKGLSTDGADPSIPDDLRGMDVQLQSQTGDIARVRMRYRLAGTPIDTVVQLERRDGRWYISDFLRHAEDAVAGADADTAAKTTP